MRILLFDFLNAYPYQAALEEAGLPYQLLADPRQVTEAWKRERPDAALLPLPAVLHEPEAWLAWGIGSKGAVRSVLLVSDTSPDQWRAIAVDSRSTASVALVRWLMAQGHLPHRPLVEKAEGPHGRLVIGDTALRLQRAFPVIIDVGERAVQAAGLPVVFAVWWVRPPLREVLAKLWAARVPDLNKAPLAAVRYRFSPSEVHTYWQSLLYSLPPHCLQVWASHYQPYIQDSP